MKKQSIKLLSENLTAAEQKLAEEQSHDKEYIHKLFEEYVKPDLDPDRQSLWRDYQGGAELTGPSGLRKRLAAIDLGYFARAYLSHYFSRPSPPFHVELDGIWQDNVLHKLNPVVEAKRISLMDGSRCVTAAPRGHAKSTNFTFKDSLHAVLYEYKHYIILLSDSRDQAVGFLSSIAEELDTNETIHEDFGRLAGGVWREDVLITKTKIKVEAMGAGQKIRGRKHKNWRPDLIVLDDIENDEMVRTQEQRKKLYNWFTKAVSKAGDSYTDIVYIGTLLHYDALLAKVLQNPGYKGKMYKAVIQFSESSLWDDWEVLYTDLDNADHEATAEKFFLEHKETMLEGTQVLWPEKNSYYSLMKSRIEDGVAAFNSELQNEPIDPETCLFNEDWIDYYNPFEVDFKDADFTFWGAVDPSLGKSKKSDFSAIITIAKSTKTGYMYVADADIERRHPDQIIDDCLKKAEWILKTYGKKYKAFGCETVQFQWFLKEQLGKASAARGIYLPLVEINSTGNKLLRIQTLQPDIKNKYIKFERGQKKLIQQLKEFPMGDHDDGPDGLEMAKSLATTRRGGRFVMVKNM